MPLRVIPDVHRATHRIGLHIARLKGAPVNQAEAHILAQLAETGDATIAALHRAFAHKRSTLTSILDRLERRKLIVRKTDARDRRSFVVTLTRRGRTVASEVARHLEAFERRALERITPKDLATFRRVLEALGTAAEDAMSRR